MNLYEVTQREPQLIHQFTAIWEDSVRATHLFLSEAKIQTIKAYVPHALTGVSHLLVAEKMPGQPVAFMGIEGPRLEMLFLSPAERGAGLGRQLLEYGILHYDLQELTVNEQNPQAVGFYRHMGFETYRRTDCDEKDGPYPLLYMKRV